MSRLYNLARMTTATTGTGTITLGSAVSGFLSFSGAGIQDGDTVTYAIQDGSNSEIGRGVYTSSGTTLTRSVLKSTNSDAAISLSGTAQVFITPAAQDFLQVVNAQTGTSYTIVSDDLGKLVTFSNTSSVAVTLPQATGRFASGWYVDVRNLNRGAATITPTTSTINGAATLVLQRGQSVRIVSDGTNYQIATGFGLKPVIQTFALSGTYTPTTGMVYCVMECVGGGGGGGGTAIAGASTLSIGGGGGGGAYSRTVSTAAAVGASQTVTIGAAGTAGSAGNNNGGAGGNTSVGSICVANGGGAGSGNDGTNNGTGGGSAGSGGTGTVQIAGEAGTARNSSTAVQPRGGGGNSTLGYGAKENSTVGTGLSGSGYGAGGGGGVSYNGTAAAAGAAGTAGYVLITEYVIG
jgi:hypothetical protein